MPKKISPEVKARAVRMVQEHQQDYPSVTAAAAAVAKQLGLGRETVRRWVVDAEIDAGARPGTTSGRARRDQGTEGQGAPPGGGQRDPEGGHDFLRGRTRLPKPLIMAFIDAQRAEGHAVESICRVLREQGCQVAARTYRAWRQGRPVAARTHADAVVMDAIIATAGTPEGLYGRRKMTAHLRRQGHPVSYDTTDRLMKTLGRNGIRRGKAVRTTIPAKDGARAGDLLNREFTAPGTEPGLGGRLHLLPHLGGVRLRRVRRRRLRPTDRGLARRDRQAHRAGADPGADGAVGPRPARPPGRRPASWSTTTTPAASTPRCGSPSTSPWRASHPRSGPSATPTTTA